MKLLLNIFGMLLATSLLPWKLIWATRADNIGLDVQPYDALQRAANDWSMAPMGEQAPFLGLVLKYDYEHGPSFNALEERDQGMVVQYQSAFA